MKRFYTLLLALTLTVGLTGCEGIFDDILDRFEDFVGDLEGDDDDEDDNSYDEKLPSEDDGKEDGEGDKPVWDDVIDPTGPIVVKTWRINTIFHLNVAQGDLEDDYADLEYHFGYDDNNRLSEMILKNYSADNDIDSTFVVNFKYTPTEVLCTIEEGVGGGENHHAISTREITATLDEWGNIVTIEDIRYNTEGERIGWEKEYLTYRHYGNSGRRLESGSIYEWIIPHGATEADFYYQAIYELNFPNYALGHHVWSGYPAYTNTYPEYATDEGLRNRTGLDLNWLLWNCSRALNYTVRGLGGLHPFLLQGLCGDPSSNYFTSELTVAPNNGLQLFYRYAYTIESKYGEGFPVKVKRYVTDDPSRDGNYALESEFWIIYEPYEYIINGKEE